MKSLLHKDHEMVVLTYFGNTSFSHKWLNLFPDTLLERDKQSFGVCRVRAII